MSHIFQAVQNLVCSWGWSSCSQCPRDCPHAGITGCQQPSWPTHFCRSFLVVLPCRFYLLFYSFWAYSMPLCPCCTHAPSQVLFHSASWGICAVCPRTQHSVPVIKAQIPHFCQTELKGISSVLFSLTLFLQSPMLILLQRWYTVWSFLNTANIPFLVCSNHGLCTC